MKILIAEDEYYARKRLEKLLCDSDRDFVTVQSVEDGAQAIEYLEWNTDVDIVITDVIMPRMDGLQLAQYIHENMPHIPVVIVSGYEEFEYARKAMEYEVKKYLVKPVNREELQEILVRLEEKKEKFRRETESIGERLLQMPYGFPFSSQIVGSSELLEKYLPDFVRAAERRQGSRMAVIQLERNYTPESAKIVHETCSRRLGNLMLGGFFCQGEDEYVLVLGKSKEAGELQNMEALLPYLCLKTGMEVVMGVSGIFFEVSGAADAYKECLYAMNNRLTGGWNRVYEYSHSDAEEEVFDAVDERRLMDAMQLLDDKKAAGIIHNLLTGEKTKGMRDVNVLYDVVLNILRTFHKYYRMQNHTQESRAEIMFSRRYDLHSFRRPKELEEYLNSILREICRQEDNVKKKSGSLIVRDICHYVEHNYQYDLSLQELAEKKYFMNASYLSRLFKNETGKTFSGYVIELRIRKARKLLEDSDLKVSDIAFQTGYNNTSHFIQSFKKIYGCTPDEMRSAQKEEWTDEKHT